MSITVERSSSCASEFALERWRQGELADREAEDIDRHLAACPNCQGLLRALEAEQPPAMDFERLLAARPERWAWLRRLRFPGLLGLGAAGAVAVLLVMVGSRLPGPGERSKGGAWQLGVVSRSAAGRTVRVEPGETLRRGDRLRFEVMGPGAGADRRYGVIVSLDSAGAVTPFWPRASEARPLAGTRQLLEEAVALDGALGPEKLFLVACAQPVAVAAVTAAGQAALARAGNRVQAVSSLGLHEAAGPGRNCQETSFWFRKVAP